MDNLKTELVAYLVSSASGCVDEPKIYGPLRLIDAAAKLIRVMEAEGSASPQLVEIAQKIETEKHLCMTDEEAFVNFLNEVTLDLCTVIDEE